MPEREIVMKKIYCIETGKTFMSTADAAREMGLKASYITKALTGKQKTAGGMHFQYAASETTTETGDKDITVSLRKVVKGKGKRSNGNTNPVLCLTDGKIYTSATDAAEQNGVNQGCMSMACRGLLKTTKGKQYCYIKDLPMHIDRISKAIAKEGAYDELLKREAERRRLKAQLAEYKQRLDELTAKWDAMHDKYEATREALINMD